MIVQAQEEIGKGIKVPTDPQHTPTIILPSTLQPSRKQKPRKTKRKNIQVHQLSVLTESVADEAVDEEMDDSLERATTTATSLDAKKDMGNISKTQSMATPNESSSQGTDLGGGPRFQEAMRDTSAHTRTKTAQQTKIDGLERRVKKLEKKHMSRTHKLKRLYKVGLTARVISFFDDKGEEVVVEQVVVADKEPSVDAAYVSVAATNVTIDDITLVKALEDLKTSKPKNKGIDKGKAKMIKEPMKLKKKDQILFDEEVARKLQKDINEQERLVGERARKEEESNIALIDTWEDIQAKLDANYQLAERMQAKEQQELNEKEREKLLMKLLEKRRKFFAVKRAEEKRNRPPTKAQQRKLFDKAMKRINTFVDFRTELVEESSKKVEAEITQEESSKRAGDELEQETAKKQKIIKDKETTNLK
uniref:Uncharacterized protein n=1 Tax=Tanacetum cinerariifolium TaxID=118510 RepID=A0A6L2KVH9_TANCI|nr:hypothetical protein [Tanacetum cinerariifolium]